MDSVVEFEITQAIPADDSTSREEKLILYNEIIKLKPELVIETGTHRGLTSMYMVCALEENGKGMLHTADPYEWNAGENFAKFKEYESYVKYHQIPGKDMINEIGSGIEFAFIDGYHEKDIVLEEIKFLLPALTDGAVVYFHDTKQQNQLCDVKGALDESGLDVEYIDTEHGMAKYIHKA